MIKFEWDESKADSNVKKHCVSFDEAKTVFYDEFATQFEDEYAEGEERFNSVRQKSSIKSISGGPL